jgi:uncharacterized membrane protein
VTASSPAPASSGRRSRWILFASLALNLFFIGACAAFAWRHYAWERHGPWTPATRMERLAAALPPGDGEKLRGEFRAQQRNIEAAITAYRQAQRHMREALRAEPFNAETLRAAMAEARTARGKLDEALQDVIATAGAAMTPEGRRSLADWTPYRRSGNEKTR